jgi:hypothetical protein
MERRRRELKELATLMALAVNDPKEIDEALKPSVAETANRAAQDPDLWDSDWLNELQ